MVKSSSNCVKFFRIPSSRRGSTTIDTAFDVSISVGIVVVAVVIAVVGAMLDVVGGINVVVEITEVGGMVVSVEDMGVVEGGKVSVKA